jgi:ABC-type nitrate/sulfonate/bicarbonate transport system substrate-binding protein
MNVRHRYRAKLFAACAPLVLAGVLVASSVTAATAAPTGHEATGKTLRVALQQPDNALPILVGLRHGYFKKAGITDIRLTLFTSLPAMFAALAGGQMDVGLQTLPALNSYNRATSGAKLKMIAPNQMNSLLWATRNDSGIPVATKANWKSSVEAWKGKKIGIPAAGGILDLFTRLMIKEAGLSSSDVSIIPVGVGPPAVAALQQGLVDVITGDTLTLALLRSQKIGRAVIAFSAGQGPASLLNTQISGWITSDDNIGKDRATYQAFTTGMQKARAFLRDPKNKKDVLDIIVRKIGIAPDQAETLYTVGVPTLYQPALNKQIVGRTLQTYLAAGVITGQPPAYSFLVADFAR